MTLAPMRQWPDDRIAFGGDYNPEQWSREVWTDDMRLMTDAGVSFVSLGIFSWSWLEPSKGEYTFEWLDEIKLAIEQIFNIEVASISTMNKKGKTRRTRFGMGKRKDTKRAIVTLKSGSIDIFTAIG